MHITVDFETTVEFEERGDHWASDGRIWSGTQERTGASAQYARISEE